MFKIMMCSALFLSMAAMAEEPIQLKGLFGNQAAVILLGDREKVLKMGEEVSGIRLLEIIDRDAVISVEGKLQRISLSKQVGGTYKKPLINSVRVSSKEGGHYWVEGQINGSGVKFIVDTGATMISMNLSTAKRLRLDYESGQPVNLVTANGTSEARLVTLDKVTVGQITQYNIQATVSLDDALPAILLGNSFLSNLNVQIENGVLIMESKVN